MTVLVVRGDARRLPLPDASVDLICTSPPYFALRSYTDGGAHYPGQIGSEATPTEYIAALIDCTREWVRVLKPSGSIFVDLGDKYAGHTGGDRAPLPNGGGAGAPPLKRTIRGAPAKSLLLLPERYRIACIDQLGLIARAVLVWAKPNGLPESVTDRVRRSHEDWVHLVKQPRYFAAVDEIRDQNHVRQPRPNERLQLPGGGMPGQRNIPGRSDYGQEGSKPSAWNPLGKLPGSVWIIPTEPLKVPEHLGIDHFAAFPSAWPDRLIRGWSPPGICIACGEGRRPVVDKQLVGVWHDKPAQHSRHLGTQNQHQHNLYGVKQTFGSTEATITSYACACPEPTAPTRPAVVLDPFSGTGTVMHVASALGRIGVGTDLSADYCRLAASPELRDQRLRKVLGLDKPEPVPAGQLELDGWSA